MALLAVVIGALGLWDWLAVAKPTRGVLAFLACVALAEGAFMLRTYFVRYAVAFENEGGYDLGKTDLLKVLFKRRTQGEEIFLPHAFFDSDSLGLAVAFIGDLDCGALQDGSLARNGIHDMDWLKPLDYLNLSTLTHDGRSPPVGSLVVGYGTQGSTPHLNPVGFTLRPNGSVIWSIYEVR
jgi:hypothetical protein